MAGAALLAADAVSAQEPRGATASVPRKRYDMKNRPLLDGTTNWPAVMDALEATGYRGYCTFEYFHPYAHYPEALIYQTSDSLDRMLGRKGLA